MATTIALALLVRHDGRVLLVHRSPARAHYPDRWDLVGGHVEPDELPRAAATRECLEEIGVRIRDPLPVTMVVDDPALEVHAFLVTRWDGEPVSTAPEEHDDLRWFRLDELPDLTLAHPSMLASIVSAARAAAGQDEPRPDATT